jgi:hypothetical protein
MLPKIMVPILLALFLLLFVPGFIPAGGGVAFAAGPWTQQAKLPETAGAALDRFGFSTALSADGNVAIVGAVGVNTGKGAAYIFTRSGATWTQRAELTDSNGVATDNFGYSVALSADGGTAIVGANGKNSGRGAAFVFTGSGSSWSQPAELTASNGADHDNFGFSVALSAAGNTALVGAAGKNSAYVFTRSGSNWTQQGDALTPSDVASGDNFGFSVALGADGDTALIGAFGKNSGQGKVYVFARSASTWALQGELTAGGAAGDGFGVSVGLGANGDTAIIGAYGRNSYRGAAYIFTRAGSSWTQQGGPLTAHNGVASDYFGNSVSLSADGDIALIGADGRSSSLGAAYVFTRSGAVWTEQGQGEISADPGVSGGRFAYSLALSGDGSTAVCGAIAIDEWRGSFYVFAFQRVKPTVVTSPTITGVTTEAAAGGGNVTAEGWASVTARGVCWGTSANPTTADSCNSDGSTGLGDFTRSITGLSPATTYHVRAYATNTGGTAFGDDVTFSTDAVLNVTLPGPGVGTVHFSTPDINCSSGTCTQSYPYGSSVTLTATEGLRSRFSGWQGSCSDPSGDCVLTMNAVRAVQADFSIDPAYAVWNDPGTIYYGSIGAAYLAADSGVTTIKAGQLELPWDIDFNLGKSITLSGGYDSSYLNNSGYTTVKGKVTVSTGSVTFNKLVIR